MAFLVLTLFVAAMVLLLSGCATRSFSDGNGVEYKSTVFLIKQNIGEATIPTKGGTITIKGYSSEQSEMTAAIVTAAVTAAMHQRVAQPRDAEKRPPSDR